MIDNNHIFTKKTHWQRVELLQTARAVLENANIDDGLRNVEWMLCELLVCNRATLYAYPEEAVEASVVERLEKMIGRRLNREPLQYILGYTEFLGHRIPVNPHVLIPRPETEWIVAESIQRFPAVAHWLDVGTGSGCIPIALKLALPHARVSACDVSPEALALAKQTAITLGAEIHFFLADMRKSPLNGLGDDRVDGLISNPPYIPQEEVHELEPEVLDYEPHLALFSEDHPLSYYQAIVDIAPHTLKPGGRLILEIHAEQPDDIQALLRSSGFDEIEILPDLSGRPRMATAVWPG